MGGASASASRRMSSSVFQVERTVQGPPGQKKC